MSKGKRYDGDQKLNIKKVIVVAIVIILIVIAIVSIIKLPKSSSSKSNDKRTITNSYISVYSNGKWGVINSKGDIIIEPTYDEMITIPDPTKEIFICQKNVDLNNKTFTSKAIDDKQNTLFTSYDEVEVLQNVLSDGSIYYQTNTLKVKKGDLYGLINFKGKELLPCEYTSIEPLQNVKNSFITVKDKLKGLVDDSGNIIIENKYADIQSLTDKYEDGYVVKNDSSKYGLINYNKKQILECKYSDISHVTGSNIYIVKEDDKIEAVNNKGEVILTDSFDKVESIENSDLVIKKDNKFGLIDSTGKELIAPEYQDLKYAFDDNYIAKKDDKYGIISKDATEKVQFKYDKITYLSEEGFFRAENSDGKSDLIDMNLNVKATGIVSEISATNGFIKLRTNGEYKYYNFKLEEKTIQDLYPANTLFISKKNGKYGFVNKQGQVIVDYKYDDATEQNSYGYAAVKKDGKWGTIDIDGNEVVSPKYYLLQNTVVSFIGKWHLAADINANYYTDVEE